MIQRIQTLWTIIGAIFLFCTIYFDIYTFTNKADNNTQSAQLLESMVNTILFVLSLGLSLVSIFFFKKRAKQKRIVLISLLITIFLLVNIFFSTFGDVNNTNIKISFGLGIIFPVLFIIFMALAYFGIAKDEKILKKSKRLR